jgi:hypothetical protein
MWSFTDRWCTINESGEYIKISQYKFKTIQEFEFYEKIHTQYDSHLDLIYRANFAKLFLDSKNIFNYHLTVRPGMFTDIVPDAAKKWNDVDFSNISLGDYSLIFPPALDAHHGAAHPGPLAHKSTAEDIYKEIINAYNK